MAVPLASFILAIFNVHFPLDILTPGYEDPYIMSSLSTTLLPLLVMHEGDAGRWA